ncbi:YbfB/YjiJ family MFS transporter [Roseicyclus sp. F158]|uniref:YbfB/YjiJ family MFS transporter n=1 Tax=Tropicimonas omnivorans TaxID=3075590 RepID=A0ABU3DKA8_9RHOB|nr:YbfB/YjiJ family MFS transporter [Roseicyclus sp. F158]MDT0684153.1 YbfB/YjiJ family MFS transporter [Roseicyclus sp. F158]
MARSQRAFVAARSGTTPGDTVCDLTNRRPIITYFRTLSAAGFAATAISYGPGRMGFGLFVPEFRSAFSMSTSAVGIVSSLGFFGFFVGLLIAQAMLNRLRPEFPVLAGLCAALVGLVIVAAAPNVIVLACGVAIAASSAGFAWTPFNDAVHRKINDIDRPTALSEISTGTSVGIMGAGGAALLMVLMGVPWRLCWAGFALLAAIALVANWAVLNPVERDTRSGPKEGWRAVLQPSAMPLFAVANVFGVTSAIYIAFAGDHVQEAGGVPGLPAPAAPALLFILYGFFGLAGFLTNRARQAVGLTWLLRVLLFMTALSLALTAFVPANWAGLVGSAGLQGMHVMMTSAVIAFWSEKLFPELPALGFTAALLGTAVGSVVGPAVAGLVSSMAGAEVMFYGAAALAFATGLLLPASWIKESPARSD